MELNPGDRLKWTVDIDRYVRSAYPAERDEILYHWLLNGIEVAADQRADDPPDKIAVGGIWQRVGLRVLIPRDLAEAARAEWMGQ